MWIAAGMIMVEAGNLPSDAIAIMRAATYASDRSLDDVATDIVQDRIDVASLLER